MPFGHKNVKTKLIFVAILLTVLTCGCPTIDRSGDPIATWTVAGTATVINSTVNATDVVRLGAFFSTYDNRGNRPDGPLVSNVVDVSSGKTFSISIDVGGVIPSKNDEIIPLYWIDSNEDGVFDIDEKWTWVNPTEGDQVFGSLEPARFGYQGTIKGWSISWSATTETEMTNAAITNALAFSESPDPWL